MSCNLLLLVFFLVSLVAAQRCEPGSVVPVDDGCNYCNCTEQGIIGECTSNDCEVIRSVLLKSLFSAKHCTPGTVLSAGDGCNKCICTEQGIVGPCTTLNCSPRFEEEI